MDISGFLILPFSALVAFIALVVAAVSGRARPRLIWPFAFSSLVALAALYLPPPATEVGVWLFTTIMVVFWSAGIGTVIGALLAWVIIKAMGRIRSR